MNLKVLLNYCLVLFYPYLLTFLKAPITLFEIFPFIFLLTTQFLFYDTPGSNFLKSLNKESKNLKLNLWSGIDKSDLILYVIDSNKINLI